MAASGGGKGAGSNRLRLTISAGEALPEEIGLRWQAKVGTEVIDGIGSTEMLHIFLTNRPGQNKYGTTGKGVPGYEIKLVGEDGEPVPPDDRVAEPPTDGRRLAAVPRHWSNQNARRGRLPESARRRGRAKRRERPPRS